MMNRTQKTSRWPPMNYLDWKGGGGWLGRAGAVSSRSFHLLNDIWSKRSVGQGWLFGPVLHLSLDDLGFKRVDENIFIEGLP